MLPRCIIAGREVSLARVNTIVIPRAALLALLEAPHAKTTSELIADGPHDDGTDEVVNALCARTLFARSAVSMSWSDGQFCSGHRPGSGGISAEHARRHHHG